MPVVHAVCLRGWGMETPAARPWLLKASAALDPTYRIRNLLRRYIFMYIYFLIILLLCVYIFFYCASQLFSLILVMFSNMTTSFYRCLDKGYQVCFLDPLRSQTEISLRKCTLFELILYIWIGLFSVRSPCRPLGERAITWPLTPHLTVPSQYCQTPSSLPHRMMMPFPQALSLSNLVPPPHTHTLRPPKPPWAPLEPPSRSPPCPSRLMLTVLSLRFLGANCLLRNSPLTI